MIRLSAELRACQRTKAVVHYRPVCGNNRDDTTKNTEIDEINSKVNIAG